MASDYSMYRACFPIKNVRACFHTALTDATVQIEKSLKIFCSNPWTSHDCVVGLMFTCFPLSCHNNPQDQSSSLVTTICKHLYLCQISCTFPDIIFTFCPPHRHRNTTKNWHELSKCPRRASRHYWHERRFETVVFRKLKWPLFS